MIAPVRPAKIMAGDDLHVHHAGADGLATASNVNAATKYFTR
jgi:hypothetical protein